MQIGLNEYFLNLQSSDMQHSGQCLSGWATAHWLDHRGLNFKYKCKFSFFFTKDHSHLIPMRKKAEEVLSEMKSGWSFQLRSGK